jgi:hypothetical protein
MAVEVRPRWLAIHEALNHLRDRSILNDFAAADLIEAGLGSGRLRARAEAFQVREGSGDVAQSTSRSKSARNTATKSEIPGAMLEGCQFCSEFFEEVRSFKPIKFQASNTYSLVTGLELHRRDFDRLVRDDMSWDISGVMKGKTANEHAWLRFIIEILELESDNELNQEDFPSDTDLLKRIMGEIDSSDLESQKLDERTFRPFVQGIWATWVRNRARR